MTLLGRPERLRDGFGESAGALRAKPEGLRYVVLNV
jgi:hypothetical protein